MGTDLPVTKIGQLEGHPRWGPLDLELTGVLGQQLETIMGLSVRDFTPKKKDQSVRRQKKKGQMVRIRYILNNFRGKIQVWTYF